MPFLSLFSPAGEFCLTPGFVGQVTVLLHHGLITGNMKPDVRVIGRLVH